MLKPTLIRLRPNRPFALLLSMTLALALTPAANADCSEEVGYVATFKVKPGSESEFEKAISNLSETVLRIERGVILYAPYKGQDNTYYMLERYENEAVRTEHATSDAVRALFPPLMMHVDGSPDVQPVSAVCP